MFQTVAGTAGESYTLSLEAGAQDWWWPNGRAYLIFLDAADAELASHEIDTTASIGGYDVGVPYQDFSITKTAPAGTTQVKVELGEWDGTGTAWFDNVVLTEQGGGVPVLAPVTTLPFTVHSYVPPTSQTNHIEGITVNSSGIYTLDIVSTVGVSYYIQTATNLSSPVVWKPEFGSMNTVTNSNGLWSYTGTNSSPQLFFRSKAAAP